MPRRGRGQRIALTVRLPFDIYREVAKRSEGRNWSMSDYVAWCVAKEIAGKYATNRRSFGRDRASTEMAEGWIEKVEAHG